MTRLRYSGLLDEIRERDLAVSRPSTLLDEAVIPPRREARKKLKVRVSPGQRAFLEDAVHSTRGTAVDESAVVALAIRIIEELDVPWDTIASREDLVSVVRRALRTRVP